MMTEKELIAKIRELGQIRPNREWVVLTKAQILGEEADSFSLISLRYYLNYLRRAVYAGLIVVFILFGLFAFAQNSLPGDILYPIKKITEKSQAVFVSEKEKPKVQLELANKRVEELNKIAESNYVQKLAPAIKEVQESLSQATKNLVKSENVDRETVDKIVNLKENLEKVETILATKITSQENKKDIENAEKNIVELLIKDLENSTLIEKQEELLVQMKELVAEEKYSEALELYLRNQ